MMPVWLPKRLELRGGSLENDYRQLYEVFTRDFIESCPMIDGKRVFFESAQDKQNPLYPCGFTHLITHDDGSGQRFMDSNRASCLPWVRAIIDNAKAPEVSAFHATQASRKHGIADNLYLWLEDLDFVVILRKVQCRGIDEQMLITAYITSEHTNRKFAKLREKYTTQ